jgi:hypothetical protein
MLSARPDHGYLRSAGRNTHELKGWFFSRNTFDESLILDHRFLKTWTAYPKTLINIFFLTKKNDIG